MTLPRGGFWPVRNQTGDGQFQTVRMQKDTGENDASLIYAGDPVRVVSGKIIRYTAGDTSANVGPLIFGVAARFLRDEAGRPRVHGLPDQHPNISLTADADWVDVWADPNIVFASRVPNSAADTLIGTYHTVATTARVTAAGISGTIVASGAVSGDRAPFVIVDVANFDLDGGKNDAGGRVEVMMNYHMTKTPADI